MINPNMSHTQIFIEMFVKKLAWHKKLSKKRNEWSNSKKDEQVLFNQHLSPFSWSSSKAWFGKQITSCNKGKCCESDA